MHVKSCVWRAAINRSPRGEIRFADLDLGLERASKAGVAISAQEIDYINKRFIQRTQGLDDIQHIRDVPTAYKLFRSRYREQYLKPSQTWYNSLPTSITKETPFDRFLMNAPVPPLHENYFFESSSLHEPLKIGDLALLKSHPSELSMCVDIPCSTADPRYTFVRPDGVLVFVTKHHVLLRIPYALPLSSMLQSNLLVRERQIEGLKPVGTMKRSLQQTFIVPLLARQQYVTPVVSQISLRATNLKHTVLQKLDIIHRHLQNDAGPVVYPFSQLVRIVEALDLSRAQDDPVYAKSVIKAKQTSVETFDAASLLAIYWGVKSQQCSHRWGNFHINSSQQFPVAVTVYPLKRHIYYNKELLQTLATGTIPDFTNRINNHNISNIANLYPQYVDLLKQYAAGNLENNPELVIVIAKIFRGLKKYSNTDISRDTCMRLYNELNPGNSSNNLHLYHDDLQLPISSKNSGIDQKIFQLSEPYNGPIIEAKRTNFGTLPVYCIDSPDAHEIDDGISIKEKGNGIVTLYTHVADPAIMFEETKEALEKNEIFEIASKRCFTTYLPDVVVPMLPASYSRKADLGKKDTKTKTLTFSVDIKANFETNEFKLLEDTFHVELGLVKNFPQGTTYTEVTNRIKRVTKDNTQVTTQLKKLFKISQFLRKQRLINEAVVFGEGFNNKKIDLTLSGNGTKTLVHIKQETSDEANLLVSEIMILTNMLTGRWFDKKKIPAIHRAYQEPKMHQYAFKQYKELLKKSTDGNFVSVSDVNKISSLLSSSYYTTNIIGHKMIGTSHYATVTSPLRRLPDLINHLQIRNFLRKKSPLFTQKELELKAHTIQTRDSILKKHSKSVEAFWALTVVKDGWLKNPKKTYNVNVSSNPQNGKVRCVLNDMSLARGTLKLDPNSSSHPRIGEYIKNCKITKIDCLENIFELSQVI